MENGSRRRLPRLRTAIQFGFLLWVVGIGIRFGLFINAAAHNLPAPGVSRPPGVEGFLPIGALASLKYWLLNGTMHPVHPAALVIFLSILLVSLVAKKSFCSWICPIGTLSDLAQRLGMRLFGRSFRIWRPLDRVLRSSKYLLLFFFIKIILLDMPKEALAAFLDTPYWAAADIKMLTFFTAISGTTLAVLTLLVLLSLVYHQFWCRYLCPYGALLGLVSSASPFKIRRDPTCCTGCRRCSTACPAQLKVHSSLTVFSPECTGCLSCVASCPEQGALAMGLGNRYRHLPLWVYPTVVVVTYLGGIGLGMASGHWHSILTYADYQQLIPLVPFLSH